MKLFLKSTSKHCRLAAALDKKFRLKIIFRTVLPRIKDLHLSELQIFPLLHFFLCVSRRAERGMWNLLMSILVC